MVAEEVLQMFGSGLFRESICVGDDFLQRLVIEWQNLLEARKSPCY
jgi:hypothetical protein